MKTWCLAGLLAAVMCVSVFAEDEYLPGKDKFQVCENKSGGGFYWLDSTTGDMWLMDTAKKAWVYCGKPEAAAVGEIGTYLPYTNKNGRGVFVLNVATGEGWFYDAKYWKALGKPELKAE